MAVDDHDDSSAYDESGGPNAMNDLVHGKYLDVNGNTHGNGIDFHVRGVVHNAELEPSVKAVAIAVNRRVLDLGHVSS